MYLMRCKGVCRGGEGAEHPEGGEEANQIACAPTKVHQSDCVSSCQGTGHNRKQCLFCNFLLHVPLLPALSVFQKILAQLFSSYSCCLSFLSFSCVFLATFTFTSFSACPFSLSSHSSKPAFLVTLPVLDSASFPTCSVSSSAIHSYSICLSCYSCCPWLCYLSCLPCFFFSHAYIFAFVVILAVLGYATFPACPVSSSAIQTSLPFLLFLLPLALLPFLPAIFLLQQCIHLAFLVNLVALGSATFPV